MRLLSKIDINIRQFRHLKSNSESLQPILMPKMSKNAFGRTKLSYSKIKHPLEIADYHLNELRIVLGM